MLGTFDTRTRRDVLKGLGMSVSAFALSHTSVAAQPYPRQLRGRVYDATKSGDGAGSGCGLSGVMVSNGRDVTLTDRDGVWSLSGAPYDRVFVIKPPQWSYANGVGIPRAFSADARGGEPLDFPLVPTHENERFEALLFADTQPSDLTELGYVRDVVLGASRETRAAFAINHGDIVGDDLSLLAPYRRILEETGLTWHHCPGNHDLDLDASDPAFAFETWKRDIGPTHYAFRYAKATFILLNNVGYLGAGAPDIAGRRYYGRFGDDQILFVSNVLRHIPRDELVVVSMHIPLASYLNPSSISETTVDGSRLLKLLAARPNTISFAGHSHTTEHHYLGRAEGFARAEPHHHHVLTAACGSWWGGPPDETGIPTAHSQDGSPKGHHVLSVSGTEASTRFVPFNGRDDLPMRAMIDDRSDRTLLVNVFDGGPRTEVECHLPDMGTVRLARRSIADPFVVAAFARDRSMYRPWVAAAPSSHLWEVRLPDGIAAGAQDVVIRTRGESGQIREVTQRLMFPA